jgi:hypothetical protein
MKFKQLPLSEIEELTEADELEKADRTIRQKKKKMRRRSSVPNVKTTAPNVKVKPL